MLISDAALAHTQIGETTALGLGPGTYVCGTATVDAIRKAARDVRIGVGASLHCSRASESAVMPAAANSWLQPAIDLMFLTLRSQAAPVPLRSRGMFVRATATPVFGLRAIIHAARQGVGTGLPGLVNLPSKTPPDFRQSA